MTARAPARACRRTRGRGPCCLESMSRNAHGRRGAGPGPRGRGQGAHDHDNLLHSVRAALAAVLPGVAPGPCAGEPVHQPVHQRHRRRQDRGSRRAGGRRPASTPKTTARAATFTYWAARGSSRHEVSPLTTWPEHRRGRHAQGRGARVRHGGQILHAQPRPHEQTMAEALTTARGRTPGPTRDSGPHPSGCSISPGAWPRLFQQRRLAAVQRLRLGRAGERGRLRPGGGGNQRAQADGGTMPLELSRASRVQSILSARRPASWA
jgi:hypothetical protein